MKLNINAVIILSYHNIMHDEMMVTLLYTSHFAIEKLWMCDLVRECLWLNLLCCNVLAQQFFHVPQLRHFKLWCNLSLAEVMVAQYFSPETRKPFGGGWMEKAIWFFVTQQAECYVVCQKL